MKEEALLRKARNSRVLNVVTMNDVKAFDRHVQRCLTVKNDRVLHSAEAARAGAEAGHIRASVLSTSTPDLSNSILSNLEEGDSKTGSVIQKYRASCDVSALRMQRIETSSTPSLSPLPNMVLNPR